MRIPFILSVALAASGCTALSERSHGSWLEQVGKPQPAAIRLSDSEAQALRDQAAQLRMQAEELRIKLAGEPSRLQRIAIHRQLGEIGDRLEPIQRALRSGGYDAPALPAFAPSTAA